MGARAGTYQWLVRGRDDQLSVIPSCPPVDSRGTAEAQLGDALQFAISMRGRVQLAYWETDDGRNPARLSSGGTGVAPTTRRLVDDYVPAAPSIDELEASADEVGYEMRMLQFTWQLRAGVLDGSVEANVTVESFLIHARNLVDFMDEVRPRDDDVLAAHYGPWRSADGGDELRWLRSTVGSLAQQVVHVTAYRQRFARDVDAKTMQEVVEKMEVVWNRFLAQLPADRAEWFGEATF